MLPLVIQIERTDEHTADTCAFAQSPVRLGRNALNDLQLDESFVSQWHGVIRFDDKQAMYLDLGSTNPTLIDGEPVKRNVEVAITERPICASARCACTCCACRLRPSCTARGARTAFARTGIPDLGGVASTMYLGDVDAAAAAAARARRRSASRSRARSSGFTPQAHAVRA